MNSSTNDPKSDLTHRSWSETASAYLKPKMLAMLALGFASGLPLMMYFSKMSRWLSDVGIDRATIGFFSWIALAYGIKFLWAPIVDRTPLPILKSWLGQRRSWIFLAIIGTIAGMLVISTAKPDPAIVGSLTPMIIGGFILTYSGATLDIAIDAWRIETGEDHEQANLAAVYQLGYRFAIMAAGYSLILADLFGWQATYQSTAFMMALMLIAVLYIKEPDREAETIEKKSFAQNISDYVVAPFSMFIKRYGKWAIPILLLIAFYRASDITMGVMAQPFYGDMGYSKTAVGAITGTFGPWPLIAGAFISGIFCIRIGLMRTLLIGAILTIITNGAFAWLGMQNNATTQKLFVTILADNLAGGFVGTALIAYMSSLVNKKYAATQYALLSSSYLLPSKFIAGFSGVLYAGVGKVSFFLITAAVGIPAVLIILFLWARAPAHVKGDQSSKAEENNNPTTANLLKKP